MSKVFIFLFQSSQIKYHIDQKLKNKKILVQCYTIEKKCSKNANKIKLGSYVKSLFTDTDTKRSTEDTLSTFNLSSRIVVCIIYQLFHTSFKMSMTGRRLIIYKYLLSGRWRLLEDLSHMNCSKKKIVITTSVMLSKMSSRQRNTFQSGCLDVLIIPINI